MDSLKHLSFIIDENMGSLKGELMQLAGRKIVFGGDEKGTVVRATLELDLNAILSTNTSTRTVIETVIEEND